MVRVMWHHLTLLSPPPPSSPALHPAQTHRKLVDGIVALTKRVQADQALTNLIRRKFAIKCTTGRGGRAGGGGRVFAGGHVYV